MALVDLRPQSRGRLLSANQALCELVDRSAEDVRSATGIAHASRGREEILRDDLKLLAIDPLARVEAQVRCLHADGHIVWTSLIGASVTGEESPQYAVVHLMDIGERKRFEGQLQYLADHDSLTGLFNRRRFEDELVRALAHTARYGECGALLMLDLDGFTQTLLHSVIPEGERQRAYPG